MNAHVIQWLKRGANQLHSYLGYYCTEERFGGPKKYSKETHESIKTMIRENEQEIEYELNIDDLLHMPMGAVRIKKVKS